MKKYKEYIVRVEYQVMFGASVLHNTFAISAETMKEAKIYAAGLVYGEITKITAHKVKEGEEVPQIYYSWLYR